MRHRRIVGIALMMFALPAMVSAQTVAATFDELHERVKSGETVYVTDDHGRTTKGRLLSVSAEALSMEADAGRVEFPVTQTDRVRVRRRDSLKNGIFTGLAVGAVIGAVLAVTEDNRSSAPCDPMSGFLCGAFDDGFADGPAVAAAGALVGGLVGIGAGVAIDAAIKERRLVYQKASSLPQSRLVIAPLVGRGTFGVVAVVRP